VTTQYDGSSLVERFDRGLLVESTEKGKQNSSWVTYRYNADGLLLERLEYWYTDPATIRPEHPSVRETYTVDCLPKTFPGVP